MHFFNTYHKLIIKQDLINKFKISENKNLPRIKEITLNFKCINFSVQTFAVTMLALEIISFKKGSIIPARKPNILLKLQKGQPAGCKVELRKKEIYLFLTKLTLEILPKLKDFSELITEKQASNFSFQLPGNRIALREFENQYPLFANLPRLNVNMKTNSNDVKKLFFLAKSIKILV